MRRYDDLVHVRRGLVQGVEAPEQFVWRDRLWRVGAVVAHWVETGPWWESRDVEALLGAETALIGARGRDAGGRDAGPVSVASLLAEREVWRVDAARGRGGSPGVFDLSFDWSTGEWRLIRCLD